MCSTTEQYEELFYDLRTGVVGNHERPHKPAMMLAVMDLIELGEITQNLIPFSTALRERFTHYFKTVGSADDKDTPWNPYFYLRSESFWSHVATPGNEAIVGALSSPPTIRKLPTLIEGAALAPDLWNAMSNVTERARLRDVLISRYFPQHRNVLLHTQMATPVTKEDEAEYQVPGRSAGFRRIVVQVYEHQCAACGLRLRRPDGSTIVDAAHIIPFSESQNDHPRNGLALCKNHHWAMDRSLIAPSPDHLWIVSKELDSRQAGEMELISLSNRPLILPKEKAYHPLPEALEWRKCRLA
jgi:putative restriction endonuclease